MDKKIHVAFGSEKLKDSFDLLRTGRYEDKILYRFIDRAMDDLKKDPSCGTKVPKRLWPSLYIQKYAVTNLWKYDLPNAWRVIYTISSDEVMIVSIVLEWFDHKGYEKRFKY